MSGGERLSHLSISSFPRFLGSSPAPQGTRFPAFAALIPASQFHQPQPAQPQQVPPSFGGILVHIQAPAPLQECAGPRQEWRSLVCKGREECRKKEAVNETQGEWKVESLFWMSIKPCLWQRLCSHRAGRFCHSAAGLHWKGCGLASRECHHLKSQGRKIIPS